MFGVCGLGCIVPDVVASLGSGCRVNGEFQGKETPSPHWAKDSGRRVLLCVAKILLIRVLGFLRFRV